MNTLFEYSYINDSDVDPYSLLACAVIRQAIHDAIEYSNHPRTKFQNSYVRSYYISDMEGSIDFIMSNRLDDFIRETNLPLNSDFIRNKYKELKKEDYVKTGRLVGRRIYD